MSWGRRRTCHLYMCCVPKKIPEKDLRRVLRAGETFGSLGMMEVMEHVCLPSLLSANDRGVELLTMHEGVDFGGFYPRCIAA